MDKVHVCIGVPTYRRPAMLRRLLNSIEKLSFEGRVSVVIADNEGVDGSGIKLAEELSKDGFKFCIRAVPVEERGISHVRNKLLEMAFEQIEADYLAMVDDDEWVESNWLSAFVEMQIHTGADVVGGAVLPEFEGGEPAWAKKLTMYWRRIRAPGPVDLIPSTTSVLISSSFWKRFSNEKFDPEFGLTGGEDKEFFYRVKKLGATFAFQPLSIAHETFGRSRTTAKWALLRSFRIGAGDARVIILHENTPKAYIKELIVFCGAFLVAMVQFAFLFWHPQYAMHALVRMSRQIGKVSGLLGVRPSVYKNVHGA